MKNRSTWHEYFMQMATLASTRSTCSALQVGAVIIKNNQVLATGYNGSPSGTPHCIDQGFCSEGLKLCTDSSDIPSRAIHAEANAIAQASKYGVSIDGGTIYVTHEPCITCLKLIIASGIKKVYYDEEFNTGFKAQMRDEFIAGGLIELYSFKRTTPAIPRPTQLASYS